ncbi:hypothetical protein QNO06_04915 [Arthrobacter sp. zg-Y20]|nr:hypothetical protein [Arthrobacter sp. zg-Y20]WIB07073.1 hypothetical protein QNO06_04915 [Arthrobacter sp. zg-Y20]
MIETKDDQVGFVPGHEQILRGLGWIQRSEATTITIHDHIRNHKDAA